ncbi:MAG: DevR family CRISPR-associated autoregulator [Polyangiales bacterium]
MSTHLFGAVVTSYGTAANNRGENEGNVTTLQKLLWRGEVHTTVSAEAIRWAVRYFWQRKAELGDARLTTNRRWDEVREDNVMRDPTWAAWKADKVDAAATYIDDDVLGFMLAEGAKEEVDAAPGDGKRKKGAKPAKGTISKRRGALEVTRAVSTSPFAGDLTFNAKSGTKGSTSLYSTEVHATRYQYGFAITPARLAVPARVYDVLDAVVGLGEVAGNHSRFLYDFAPESVVFRVTDDMAPRLLYCFQERDGAVDLPDLVRRVEGGDIKPGELVIGGAVSTSEGALALKKAGVEVVGGVRAAAEEVHKRLRARPDLAALAGAKT